MRRVVLVPDYDPLNMEALRLDNGFAMYHTRWEYIDGYPGDGISPASPIFLEASSLASWPPFRRRRTALMSSVLARTLPWTRTLQNPKRLPEV